MKRYRIGYEPEARTDLDDIYTWIAREGGVRTADGFVSRLGAFCDGLENSPLRGPIRNDLKAGVRTVTFEKSVTVAFLVSGDRVDIVRFLYRGRNVSDAFKS